MAFSEQYFDDRSVRRVRWSTELLERAERALRINLDWERPEEDLLTKVSTDDSFCIQALDHVLGHHELSRETRRALDDMLTEAGSMWRVSPDGGSLIARVSPALEEMVGAKRSVPLIEHAWVTLHRREPNPSEAYRDAVRALEAVLKPVVAPKDDLATLGKMIATVRQAPHKFELLLPATDIDGVDVFRANLELIWKGQSDRHGTDVAGASHYVSRHAAEIAVSLAVACIHLVEAGLFRRVAVS